MLDENVLALLSKQIVKKSRKGTVVLSYYDVLDLMDPIDSITNEEEMEKYLTVLKERHSLYDEKNPHDFLNKVRNLGLHSYSEQYRIQQIKKSQSNGCKIRFRDLHMPIDTSGKYIVEFDEKGNLSYDPQLFKIHNGSGTTFYSMI